MVGTSAVESEAEEQERPIVFVQRKRMARIVTSMTQNV